MRRPLIAIALLALWLMPGVALADPPVGKFKIFLGDGNRVYTLGGLRKLGWFGWDGDCKRSRRSLIGQFETKCTVLSQGASSFIWLEGAVDLVLSGSGPDKRIDFDLDGAGFNGSGSRWVGFSIHFAGTEHFVDGTGSLQAVVIGSFCGEVECSEPFATALSIPIRARDGLWKLRIDVKEKEPGVLRGKAVARLFESRVRYEIEGTYDAITGMAALNLVGLEHPRKHSMSLSNVTVVDGTVSGQLGYDLYGQTGALPFDVPLTPPAN